MTRLIKYIIFSLLLTNMAAAQIDIPITPPVNPPKTPVDPPGTREPISVRPDPSRPGGGDFDGKFYEYCGPSWLGYKCNFLRSDGVAKMRDVSNAYREKQVSSYQKEMDAATAKVDKDLASLREGLVAPDSEEGKQIRAKLDAAKGLKANAATIDNATLQFQETATTDIDSTVDVSFGLAYKENDKKDYAPEARKITLRAFRQLEGKVSYELDRADAVQSKILSDGPQYRAERLMLTSDAKSALHISRQSLSEGNFDRSQIALRIGQKLLDTAINFAPLAVVILAPEAVVVGGLVTAAVFAKDYYEARSGKSLITGERLDPVGRSMAILGASGAAVFPVLQGTKALTKTWANAIEIIGDLTKANVVPEEAAAFTKSLTTATKSADEIVEALYATKPGEAVFWSGRSNGIGGPTIAEEIAVVRGGTTLEKLMADRGIVLPAWDASSPSSLKAWADASRTYAEGASGRVTAILGDNMRPGSIWETVEFPALKSNPRVTEIIRIDPATGAQTVLYTR